jgi:hypothetical protein
MSGDDAFSRNTNEVGSRLFFFAEALARPLRPVVVVDDGHSRPDDWTTRMVIGASVI